MSFYSKSKFLLAGLIRKLWRIRVVHPENERPEKTYLICANHQSLLDPVLLGAAIQHNPRYMAKAELQKIPLLKQLIVALGAYFVDRGGSDVSAIKKTITMLKDGESVIMFPQGTRHKGVDPATTKVKFGCSMIAARANVSVLPIFIEVKNYRVRLFRKTVIHIGKEIPPEELEAVSEGPDDYRSGAELIFSRILALSEEC
jgi:1-acyl-sn-glycerol-3-phosphate acyltransferase